MSMQQVARIGRIEVSAKGWERVFTDEEKQKVYDYYMSGHTYGEIEKKYGIWSYKVKSILKEFIDPNDFSAKQKAQIGKVGAFDKGRKLFFTDEEKREIYEYYISGHNYEAITQKYNIRPNTIQCILSEFIDPKELSAKKAERYDANKEVRILFRKYFLGQKQGAIVQSEGIHKRTIYRIQEREPKVVKILSEAREQLAQKVATCALEQEWEICGILRDYIGEIAKKEKRLECTAPQAATVVKTIVETFGNVAPKEPETVNREAQDKLCNYVTDARASVSGADNAE